MTSRFSRREFVIGGAAGAAGLVLGGVLPGCGGPAPLALTGDPVRVTTSPPVGEVTYVAPSAVKLPYLEAAGTPWEIGRTIGQRFGDQVRLGLERRADWFKGLKDFAAGEGKPAMAGFLAAARRHTPRAVAELEGWAEGSGVPFHDLLVLNLKAELDALMKQRAATCEPVIETHPGCSTIVLATGDRLIHLHNEDGADAYADLMFMLLCRPEDGPAYLTLSYPGILPGNTPAINANGLAICTNFIGTDEVRLGVGRHFLDRMLLEAADIDEALRWSRHPQRAYAYHHVFTSIPERRAVAIEVTPSRHEAVEIDGLYIHTNHLVFETMKDEVQDAQYVSSSSTTRYDVLSRWRAGIADPSALTAEQLLEPLASHEGAPYSPCRHPEGEIRGFTLATAVFEAPAGSMRVYKNQPCQRLFTDYQMPG